MTHGERMRRGTRAFLTSVAEHRDYAQTLLVEIIGAGPRAAQRRDQILVAFAETARRRERRGGAPRADRAGSPRGTTRIAIVGGITELDLAPGPARRAGGRARARAGDRPADRGRARAPASVSARRSRRAGDRRRAAAARGWSRGARRSLASSGPRSSARSTGAGRCRDSAIRRRGCSCSGWRRRRTAATAPGGSSPATARATGCSRRCGGPGSRISRRRSSRDDGLALSDCYMTAAVRCAPPANRPMPAERDNCLPYLVRELALLRGVGVIVCLGGFAWDVALRVLARAATPCPGRGRSSVTAPRRRSATSRCSAATTRASRTRSRAS